MPPRGGIIVTPRQHSTVHLARPKTSTGVIHHNHPNSSSSTSKRTPYNSGGSNKRLYHHNNYCHPSAGVGVGIGGALGRHSSIQAAISFDDQPIPEEEEDDEQPFELLEYEWPDLPPIPSMKDAVSRKRVSQGISYLLPVDKGRNSINNRFRTDLRAMFQVFNSTNNNMY